MSNMVFKIFTSPDCVVCKKEIPVEWANDFEQKMITIEEAGKDNYES